MSETLDMPARVARLRTMLAEGRVIRGEWSNTAEDGRERACLLAALSPEVAQASNTSACPASVMPAWLAQMVPVIDDNGSDGAWPAMTMRFAGIASRWHVLTDEDWQGLNYTTRRVAVEHARQYAGSTAPAVDNVLALLRRAEAGESVAPDEWAAASAAAWDAASAAASAASAAWDAASAAASAASAAEAARAAAEAARAAASAAAWDAASAAWDAAWAAAWAAAARAAAWDAITSGLFDAIEARIAERETQGPAQWGNL